MKKTKEEKEKAKIKARENEVLMVFIGKLCALQENGGPYTLSFECTKQPPTPSSQERDWLRERGGLTTMQITLIYP